MSSLLPGAHFVLYEFGAGSEEFLGSWGGVVCQIEQSVPRLQIRKGENLDRNVSIKEYCIYLISKIIVGSLNSICS